MTEQTPTATADPNATCRPQVNRILDKSAERVFDSVVAAGGVALDAFHIAAVVTTPLQNVLPRGLAWTVGRGLGAATQRVRTLVGSDAWDQHFSGLVKETVGGQVLVNELGGLLPGPLTARIVSPPLGAFLQVGVRIVPETDALLATASRDQLAAAYNAMENVVVAHSKRARWALAGNVAVRVISAAGFIQVAVAVAAASVIWSVYLAHNYLDSPRLASFVPKRWAGIPSAVKACVQ